jgi:signal transduction histidine kinase
MLGKRRLGLAIAHRYAEIMHGNLDVATAAGETIFTVRVPDQRAETDIHPSKGWR